MEMLMELTTLQKKVILIKFKNEGLISSAADVNFLDEGNELLEIKLSKPGYICWLQGNIDNIHPKPIGVQEMITTKTKKRDSLSYIKNGALHMAAAAKELLNQVLEKTVKVLKHDSTVRELINIPGSKILQEELDFLISINSKEKIIERAVNAVKSAPNWAALTLPGSIILTQSDDLTNDAVLFQVFGNTLKTIEVSHNNFDFFVF